ncbi:MAG TPA: DUF4129 domain-containing protein [Planctomycetaceae bacterium]|nr:DUF4129 domain-containing protein [Planctomycetaceae bacterium]
MPGRLILFSVLLAQSGGPLFLAQSAGPLPDPQIVRQTARDVLARPEYQLDPPTDFSDFIAQFWDLIRHVLRAIQLWFAWLAAMSPILAALIVLALVVSVLLLLGHIGWTLVAVARGDRRGAAALAELSRRKVDPAELAREADHAGASGNYILGVRLLYRACLTRLEQTEERAFRPGATNREHLNRYRATPLYDWLARFVSIIDMKWYGSEPCLASDFAECRDAYERITLLARGRAHAHHA